jgi:NAD(P)H dehydrogenase (quinone)
MMAKVLIIYHSRTGNTEAMAEAVEAGIKREGLEVTRKRIEEASVDDLLEPDGIIIGSPTYFAAAAEVKKFINESIKHVGKLEGKIGAAFSSSGDLRGGSETAILDVLGAFLVHGMIVQGATQGVTMVRSLWALRDRIKKLERLVGKLTLENEFLKRGLQHSLSQSQRNGKSSPGLGTFFQNTEIRGGVLM